MSWELIIVGAVLLAAGIVMNHFVPNKYWIALVIVGIIVLAIGVILLAMAAFMILPIFLNPLPVF